MLIGRPRSTVHQVLRRGGCSRREPSERPGVVCYEWPCLGNLLHMDVKKLNKFTEPGHALTGDRTRRSRRAGWEYVHSIVDDCSRLAYSEIHDDEKAPTVTAFTRRALDWFLDRGIVAERLMTDNAFTYVHNKTLRELLYRRQVRHLRTRPYTPRTNGKVERYQQTLQREWAYALQYASSDARRAALPPGSATTTSSAPTAPSSTAHPSHAFGTSPGTTPKPPETGPNQPNRRGGGKAVFGLDTGETLKSPEPAALPDKEEVPSSNPGSPIVESPAIERSCGGEVRSPVAPWSLYGSVMEAPVPSWLDSHLVRPVPALPGEPIVGSADLRERGPRNRRRGVQVRQSSDCALLTRYRRCTSCAARSVPPTLFE